MRKNIWFRCIFCTKNRNRKCTIRGNSGFHKQGKWIQWLWSLYPCHQWQPVLKPDSKAWGSKKLKSLSFILSFFNIFDVILMKIDGFSVESGRNPSKFLKKLKLKLNILSFFDPLITMHHIQDPSASGPRLPPLLAPPTFSPLTSAWPYSHLPPW